MTDRLPIPHPATSRPTSGATPWLSGAPSDATRRAVRRKAGSLLRRVLATLLLCAIGTPLASPLRAGEVPREIPQQTAPLPGTPTAGTAPVPAAAPDPVIRPGDPARAPGEAWLITPPPAGQTLPETWRNGAIGTDQLGQAVRRQWPFSPQQVGALFEMFKRMTAATRIRRVPPRLVRRVLAVTLDPAAPVPVLRIAPGYPTALTFTDVTGAPWPVARVFGDHSFFAGTEPTDGTPTLYLTPTPDEIGALADGAIMVELVGLDTPLTFDLRVARADAQGRRTLDSVVALRLPRPGPKADPADLIDAPAFEAEDPRVAALLVGAIPEGAEELVVTPQIRGLRAWRLDGHVYLKTFGQIVLPAPLAGERSPGGTTLYKLPETPRAVIAREGRPQSLTLRSRRYADDK